MISELEQQTLDIDWFFTDNEEIAFVASGAGKLPFSIAKSNENNIKLSNFFRNLSERCDAIINHEIKQYIEEPNMKMYLNDFTFMAKKGLYAFDKTVLNNFSEPNYHLVARPQIPLKLSDLPNEIKEILLETLFIGNLNRISNIDISKIQ